MRSLIDWLSEYVSKHRSFVSALLRVVLIAVILIAAFFVIKTQILDDGKSDQKEAVQVEAIPEEEGGGPGAAGPESAGSGGADAEVHTAAENGGDENLVVTADVAQMDDEEDPQEAESMNEDGAGAKIDMSEAVAELQKKGAHEQGNAISLGIDVAKWQGTIDWGKVADSGVDYAIIRVGYRTQKTGIISEDPLAKYNMQQAQKAGLKLGVYFFSTAVNEEEAREEAAWVCSFIAQYPITYPVAYNCEGFQSSESRQYGLDKTARTNNAAAFLDYVRDQGYTPMFYAAKNELEGSAQWETDRLSSKYKIWVSQYPDLPYPETAASSYGGEHDMWQYTSQGMVPGVGKGADLNVAYFSYKAETEAKDSSPVEVAQADPEALLNMTEVNETVTAKIETNLRSLPSTASEDTIVGKLQNGETAVRTAVSPSGWSRLESNGQRVYAVSSYLTTDLGFKAPEVRADTSIYQGVNETVTAKSMTNLRSEASSSKEETIAAVLHNGETVTRTGVGSNGWSQVDYNGQTLYAISSYLTTDLGFQETAADTSVYTDVNEKVTAKIETNLRSAPSQDPNVTIVATIHNGDVVTRTGVNTNTGWSRLDYNGQTVYAVTSYLTAAGE